MRRGVPLGPTLAVAAALPVLLYLGTWQIHRLHWKEAILERLATAPKLAALDHPNLTRAGLDFRRATVDCTPTADPPRVRAGRDARGEVGYSYLLKCAGGRLGLDAGWAPRPDLKPFALAAAYPGLLRERPDGTYTLIATRVLPPLVPSAPPSVEEVPNNHLAYAVQWFLFAGALLGVYGVYVYRWRKPPLRGEGERARSLDLDSGRR